MQINNNFSSIIKKIAQNFINSNFNKLINNSSGSNLKMTQQDDSKDMKYVIDNGGPHYETTGINKDKNRNFELSQLGYKILRFSNLDINSNFEGVCETINSTIKTLLC